MINSTYNTIRTIYALFVFNFVLCAIFFIPFHEATAYRPDGYRTIVDQSDFFYLLSAVYSYYLGVYAVMCLAFSTLFICLKLYNKSAGGYAVRWVKLLVTLFFVGLVLHGINKFICGYWNHFSPPLWLLNVSADYLFDVLSVYVGHILYWVGTTVIATFVFVKMGLASDS